MIKCLVIGNSFDVQKYSSIIGQSKYFDSVDSLIVSEGTVGLFPEQASYDALFLISQIEPLVEIISNAIKAQKSIYLTDQVLFTEASLQELYKLHHEAKNLIYIEKLELEHPLIDDFLVKSKSRFRFRYSNSISNEQMVRPSLFSALCFMVSLSSMQVKEVVVNASQSDQGEKEAITIQLKMLDRSISQISLLLGHETEHLLWIDSNTGQFTFNFSKNYLENVHGKRFETYATTPENLLQKSVDAFGLCIILNKPPTFTFHDYMQVITILLRVESILQGSF